MAGVAHEAASSKTQVSPSPAAATRARAAVLERAAAARDRAAAVRERKSERQRIAYKGPTVGGSLLRTSSPDPPCDGSTPGPGSTNRLAHASSGGSSNESLVMSSRMLKAKPDGSVRRGSTVLVTADGLLNSGDMESIVKQRRYQKKAPSSTSLQNTPRRERGRPGSAYALAANKPPSNAPRCDSAVS